MEFTRNEADDFLLELFNYITAHKCVVVEVVPVYTSAYNAAADDESVVSFDSYQNSSSSGSVSWKMEFKQRRNNDNNNIGAGVSEYCQRMIRMNAIFQGDGGGGSSNNNKYRLTISYMVCKSTLKGFYYYISFFNWVARCASVIECVALLDAVVALELSALIKSASQQQDDMELILFLNDEKKCIRLNEKEKDCWDLIRLKSIERKIQLLLLSSPPQ